MSGHKMARNESHGPQFYQSSPGSASVLSEGPQMTQQQKFSGFWHAKAMVHNGSLPNHKIPTRVFPVRVTSLEEGDLEVTITFWKKHHCHEFKLILKKTEEPGKYTTSQLLTHKDPKTGKRVHDKKVVHIEKTSVKDHYIFYCEDQNNGKFGMGKLMGRDSEENPEAMEEFVKFIHRMGLREENMFVPENRDECVDDSD